MVTGGQITVLILAAALLAVGWGLSVARLWWERTGLRLGAKACSWLGILAGAAALAWHIGSKPTGNWLPLEDNFEAFLWLALLLAVFVMYVQRARPVGGLDWFVMPIV